MVISLPPGTRTEDLLGLLEPIDIDLFPASNEPENNVFQNHNPRSFLRSIFGGKAPYVPKPSKNYEVRRNVPKHERPFAPRPLRQPMTAAGIELLGHPPRGRKPRAR